MSAGRNSQSLADEFRALADRYPDGQADQGCYRPARFALNSSMSRPVTRLAPK